jgi:ribosomal protein L20
MPRSVNSVAKEQEEKKYELAKGYFGRRKTFGQWLKCGRESNVLRLP